MEKNDFVSFSLVFQHKFLPLKIYHFHLKERGVDSWGSCDNIMSQASPSDSCTALPYNRGGKVVVRSIKNFWVGVVIANRGASRL